MTTLEVTQAQGVLTVEELASHNQPNDLWIAVDGKVYDITKYTEIHPGGVQILCGVAGTNATAAFHDVGHSEDAHETLQAFLVGTLEQSEEETRVRPIFQSTVLFPAAAATYTSRGFHVYLAISLASLKQALSLTCMIVAAKFLLPDLVSVAVLSGAVSAVSSFWKGVILSSAASGMCLWIVGSEVGKSLDMTDGLRRYPPIMKPTKALHGPSFGGPRGQAANNGALNPSHFSAFILTERMQLTPNTHRFKLQVSPDAQSMGLLLSSFPVGQHVQVRADIDTATVVRSYTPTDMDTQSGCIELTIKVYAGSKMGNHLLHLPLGAAVDLRGPVGHFKGYHRFLCSELAMIAGGTGITPMWQLIKAICGDPADETCITLLYANRTPADILLRKEIDALAASCPNKLKVHYFLSADPSTASWVGERGRVTAHKLAQLLPPVSKTAKYLICGPDPMVDAVTQDLVGLGCDHPKAFKHATDQVFVF
ncbi:cytochrome b5 [Exophiala viscosa]|uniref:cytochrome b5 n=1 Tax=Exophiala viscosa TaxID=2486360 RepID=UPI002192AAA2|nr:cytochrome b5 [Exophiala viscosa]